MVGTNLDHSMSKEKNMLKWSRKFLPSLDQSGIQLAIFPTQISCSVFGCLWFRVFGFAILR
jgi:hypothetical protein